MSTWSLLKISAKHRATTNTPLGEPAPRSALGIALQSMPYISALPKVGALSEGQSFTANLIKRNQQQSGISLLMDKGLLNSETWRMPAR